MVYFGEIICTCISQWSLSYYVLINDLKFSVAYNKEKLLFNYSIASQLQISYSFASHILFYLTFRLKDQALLG